MIRKAALALVVAGVLGVSDYSFTPSVQAAPGQSAQARVSLSRSMPAINFNNVSLRDCIDFVRDVSGANVHVNWRALEAAGVSADTTVNLKLRQVTLRKVLQLLLSEAGGGSVPIAFYVDDGVVEVTTQEIADSQMYTVVYDVQDLLFEPPAFTEPPDFSLSTSGNGGGGGGRRGGGGGGGGRSGGGGGGGYSGGGGGGIFGGGSSSGANQKTEKDAKAKELVQLIVDTVQPTVWVQNGGKASIRFFNGNLVVTAPRSVHEQIGGTVD